MLHLLTGLEVVSAGNALGLLPDAMTAAEARQRGIRQIRSGGQEFFMDPDEIAFGPGQQLQDLLPIRFRFLGPDD